MSRGRLFKRRLAYTWISGKSLHSPNGNNQTSFVVSILNCTRYHMITYTKNYEYFGTIKTFVLPFTRWRVNFHDDFPNVACASFFKLGTGGLLAELLYRYKRAKTSRITVLNMRKLYLYFVYFMLLYVVYFEWNPLKDFFKNNARATSGKSSIDLIFIFYLHL